MCQPTRLPFAPSQRGGTLMPTCRAFLLPPSAALARLNWLSLSKSPHPSSELLRLFRLPSLFLTLSPPFSL